MTEANDDISLWIAQLKDGDSAAAELIWGVYFPRLVSLARTLLRNTPRSANDEEDIALSAFKSFVHRVPVYQDLRDRDELWKLLMTIALRKSFREIRKGKRYSEADVQDWIEQLPSREPTPEDAYGAIEELDRLLGKLPDEKSRKIFLSRLAGEKMTDIAGRFECSVSKVERTMRLVKRLAKG